MSIIALRIDGTRIGADEAAPKEEAYCQMCGCPMHVKKLRDAKKYFNYWVHKPCGKPKFDNEQLVAFARMNTPQWLVDAYSNDENMPEL